MPSRITALILTIPPRFILRLFIILRLINARFIIFSLTKEYPKLDVKWSFIAQRLRDWSPFLNNGKKITIMLPFYYQALDPGKPSRGGATANQLADLEARTAGVGRSACIREEYAIMRCPGRPCTKGSHYWQDGGIHRRVQPHHISMLADHLQAGKPLSHDDVPDEFRRLVKEDERQWEEREQKERERTQGRKRRRRGSDGSSAGPTVIHCHQGSSDDPPTAKMIFPTSPLLRSDLPREEGVRACSVWQRSQVSTEEQKNHYTIAEELTLMHCLDLGILASNPERMFKFYTKNAILEGVAWHFVYYVRYYLSQRERAYSV
ncbi:hypothetical protein FOFC_13766 [Fusarium oxysporum]|nr:hypothetical protein FOMA001_g20281 [Fusarium oxysporum f. sp. matthiolae]KAI8406296.1 hypothetical protein FOFC_13766 [Fusarium oxysporum]